MPSGYGQGFQKEVVILDIQFKTFKKTDFHKVRIHHFLTSDWDP